MFDDHMDQDLRTRIRAWKTRPDLRRPGPYDTATLDCLRQLADVALAAIALNPDHHADARRIAEAMLRQRGLGPEIAMLVVPGFVRPGDHNALRGRLLGSGHRVRRWAGLLSFVLFGGILLCAGIAVESEQEALRQAHEQGLISTTAFRDANRRLTNAEIAAADPDLLATFPSETRLKNLLAPQLDRTEAGRRRVAAEATAYWLIGAWTLSLLIWFGGSVLRREPARLLVLRRFNDKALSRAAEMLIQHRLRRFGHVITLSDRFLRRSRWEEFKHLVPPDLLLIPVVLVWFPLRLLLRVFNRSKHGVAYVGNSRDYRHLALRLIQRIALNLQMTMSSAEAILIRSNDTWWKPVVAMVMASADVVVADLSDVADGTTWELDRIDSLDLYDKVVFVALDGRLPEARAVLERYPKAAGRHVFSFDPAGRMKEDAAFVESLLQVIAASAAIGASPAIARNRRA